MNALSQLGRRTKPPPISWLMATALAHPEIISLAAGFTDDETLPVADAAGILQEVLGSEASGRSALQYGSTIGDPELRAWTTSHLRRLDGAKATERGYSPERCIITNGSQQLLYMVAEALCDPGDIVLVEEPTYFVWLGILQSHGLIARGIRIDEQGLDLDHLDEVLESLKNSGDLPRVKLLYLVTYYQNPTGTTTTVQRKRGAAALLKKYKPDAGHPIYLLEDAAYRELRVSGEDIPSTLTVAGTDAVIYTGTYSKPFATGARVGFALLPPSLLDAVLHIKANHDFGSSSLLQKLLARALASGRYDRHLIEVRARYASKARVMLDAIRHQFPASVEWREPGGGLYVWARLPKSLKCGMNSKLFKDALKAGVMYVPGELCYAEDSTRRKPNHEMRLSFGGVSEQKIGDGIGRLGRVIAAQQTQPGGQRIARPPIT